SPQRTHRTIGRDSPVIRLASTLGAVQRLRCTGDRDREREADMRVSHGRWRWLATALAGVLLLIASGCSKSDNNASITATTIFVQKFRYNGVPSSVPAGINTFLFQNRESFPITHEMIPIALPSGKTAQDVIDAAKAPGDAGPASEDMWLHIGGDFGPADTGASVVETLDLPPGTYAFACWQTGTQSGGQNGPPHASIGMVAQFTVT